MTKTASRPSSTPQPRDQKWIVAASVSVGTAAVAETAAMLVEVGIVSVAVLEIEHIAVAVAGRRPAAAVARLVVVGRRLEGLVAKSIVMSSAVVVATFVVVVLDRTAVNSASNPAENFVVWAVVAVYTVANFVAMPAAVVLAHTAENSENSVVAPVEVVHTAAVENPSPAVHFVVVGCIAEIHSGHTVGNSAANSGLAAVPRSYTLFLSSG